MNKKPTFEPRARIIRKNIKNEEHFYAVKSGFKLEDENIYKMIFDYHLLKSEKLTILEKREPQYRLRSELLSDLINKLSPHVNRLGLSYLEL